MASQYRNGADLELAARHKLEARFPFVIRSAGSKGPADVIAAERGVLVLVQCKTTGRMTKAQREAFGIFADLIGAFAVICTWVKEGRAARVPGFELVNVWGDTYPLDPDPAAWFKLPAPVLAGGSE